MLEKIYYHIECTVKTLITIIRFIFLSQYRKVKSKISNNINLLILANGPSLNTLINNYESFLNDKILLCVNFFPNTAYFEKYKPNYHVISAPELWRSDAMPEYIELSKLLFENLAKKTEWHLTLFIPFEAKKFKTWQKIIASNTYIKVQYFNPTPVEGYKWFRHLAYNLQLGMPRPHNVLIPSIMLGMALRFKTIYLWGADHSWLNEISVDDNNCVLVNQKHFYDENTSKSQPMNKFKGTRRLHEVLIKFVHAFKGYFDIEEYAQSKRIKIYNATPNSYIDAFERYKNF